MEEMQMKLQPMKVGKYWEQVLIFMRVNSESEWYPSALVHIDAFWQGNLFPKPNIYSRLNCGEVVIVDARLTLAASDGYAAANANR